jgi:outer membrane immunogenic protein
MPLKAPATIASSWTGFYGGLGLGGRWAENDWRTSDVLAPFGFTQTAGDHGAMDSVAARISTFAGYNWQFAPAWIVGVEGDIGWANNNKTTTPLPGTIGNSLVPVAAVTNPPGGTVKESWDASVRARLGTLILPDTLLFGTAGIAWQRAQLSAFCTAFAPGSNFCTINEGNPSFSATMSGWTLGGGVERRIAGHWIARAEYRYADYGTFNQAFFSGGSGFSDRFTAHVAVRTHTANVGLAYQF